MKKILIRAYGSHLMGMGHLYRMQKLMIQLKEKIDCKIILITRNFDESQSIYKNTHCDKIIELSSEINEDDEIKYLKSFKENYFDLCINDQLNSSIKIGKELSRISKKSISFDDNGNGNIFFDKLINVLYPSNKNLKNEITSYKYLIINDYTVQKNEYILRNNVNSIFINQGAADTWGAIPEIINDLNKIDSDITLVVLLGPAFNHYEKLSLALKNTNKKIIIYNKTQSVIDIAKKCDIAIVGAGNTLFELASLGIPIIASTKEEKELITIKRLLSESLVVSSGKIYDGGINLMVKKLMVDDNLRKKLYEKSRTIFQYDGLENILNTILEEI